MNSNQYSKKKGFTLVEIIVSVGIFSIVMLIAVGALLSVIDANRKAQAMQNVINNLNFAIESMSRETRVGTTYHCGETGALDSVSDCSNGEYFAFEPSGGDPDTTSDQKVFRLNNGAVERSDDGGANFLTITSPQVTVDRFKLFVEGTSLTDNLQPHVTFVINGTVTAGKFTDVFNIETTVTQRLLDG